MNYHQKGGLAKSKMPFYSRRHPLLTNSLWRRILVTMKPDIDFSTATVEHYQIVEPDVRKLRSAGEGFVGTSLAGRFGGSLAGAEAVFNSLSENEAIRTDSIVGIGRGKFLCPKSARELFFISSCVGHRTNFSVVEKSSIHVSGISDFHVMWGGNDIIAHSHVDAFDEGMTRKTADRKLVWSTLPQYVVCMSGRFNVYTFGALFAFSWVL